MNTLRENGEVVMTTCHGHCTSNCLLKLHVNDGIITKIETDDGQEPQYRACAKGRAFRQLLYSPDRLKFPLRRTGERGEGKFEQISWDEAFEAVASHIRRVAETYGAGANILLCSTGDQGWLNNGGLIERVLVRAGGYSGVLGTVSSEGTWFASMATYGVGFPESCNSRDSLSKSHFIILWGWNPTVARGDGNMPWDLVRISQSGTKVISIDPRYTSTTALLAHQWIPIRPGSDAAMGIAMAYVIITEELQDQEFLDKYTIGFGEFKNYVLGNEDGLAKTPAWAEDITGVPAATIADLARAYARAKPAAILDGFAPGRTAYGEQFNRVLATLAAMTGNIGIAGGSAGCSARVGVRSVGGGGFVCSHMTGGDNPLDRTAPLRKDSVFYQRVDRNMKQVRSAKWYSGGPSTSYLNRVRVANAIIEGRSGGYAYDYKLIYLININWLNQYGNTNRIAEALRKLEFVVVQEQFMTATAKFADIVLPTNTFMERDDVTPGGMAPLYGYMNRATNPIGESKSHFEIATGLAAKLGLGALGDKTDEQWLRATVQTCEEIPDYDTFKKEGIHKVNGLNPVVAFEGQIKDPVNKPFRTPSGKIEIYCESLETMGDPMLPPIPKYIETWESRNDPLAGKYPLQLITSHPLLRIHTQFQNVSWLRELEPQALHISRADAESRGIRDGDAVRAFNDRGQTTIPARVTERIMPGVVDIPEGSWYEPDENGVDRGGCANVLTRDEPSPGGAFCSNTTLVEVEKL